MSHQPIEEITIDQINFKGILTSTTCEKMLSENVSNEVWERTKGYVQDDYGIYRTFTSESGLIFCVYEIAMDTWNNHKIVKIVQPGIVPRIYMSVKIPLHIRIEAEMDDNNIVHHINFYNLHNGLDELFEIEKFLRKVAKGFALKDDTDQLEYNKFVSYYVNTPLSSEEIKIEFLKNRAKRVKKKK